VSLLNELIFRDLGSKVPAANKWYTFAPSLEVQALGSLTHGLLGRVVARLAEGTNNVPEPAPGDPDIIDASADWKLYLGIWGWNWPVHFREPCRAELRERIFVLSL
jgi:hypothetical protein